MIKGIKTYLFIIILCSISALILAIVSTSLRPTQITAKNSYRNKELLKAADLLPATASYQQVQAITTEKITPMITDNEGNTFTFEEKNIDYTTYLEREIKPVIASCL